MVPIAATGVHHLSAHQVDHRDHFEGLLLRLLRPIVRIHVFEFIGGGGLVDAELPAGLAQEGDLMCGALLADLLELPGFDISYSRDARLAPLDEKRFGAARVCWRQSGVGHDDAFAAQIEAADAVWPIAPETGGALQRAAEAVLGAKRRLIGARPLAIERAASKRATARALLQAGVPAVPAFVAGEPAPEAPGCWVVKPDDGAGCESTTVWPDRRAALDALAAAGPGFVAQPWIDGAAMSLSVIADPAAPGGVDVLSVNRQHLGIDGGTVALRGLEVNAAPVTAELERLAAAVAAAIPGLAGYFGIDFVMSRAGPVVIEVNPRLTTACAGLRKALGINVAGRVLAAAGIVPAQSRSSTVHETRSVLLDLAGVDTQVDPAVDAELNRVADHG
jgi:predicted ATP-grasp superfamily ATP-dependent carboligase